MFSSIISRKSIFKLELGNIQARGEKKHSTKRKKKYFKGKYFVFWLETYNFTLPI